MNISNTIGHQMICYVPTSLSVCFCTTWGNQNKQHIAFSFNAISLFDSINVHLARFVYISSTLVDSLSNCAVVQLLTVNIQNIDHLRKHRQGDAFFMCW